MIKLSGDGPVVMVDDNLGDVYFVERCFSMSKVKNPWLSFARGSDFLDMLRKVKAGTEPMPALVLLDLNMPQMSGVEVLSEVREDRFFDEVPIFCVLTSSSDPRDAERAKQLGVSGFYTKAASMDEYVTYFDGLLP